MALPELRTETGAVSESLARLGQMDLVSMWIQIANSPLELDGDD